MNDEKVYNKTVINWLACIYGDILCKKHETVKIEVIKWKI